MLTKNANTNPENNNFNRLDESKKLMDMFKKQGAFIAPQIPEGEHLATFKGWIDKEFYDKMGVKMYDGFTVRLQIGDKEYNHDMPFSAKEAEAGQKQFSIYLDVLKAIARQFGVIGEVYIDDVNAHIGKQIDLHVVKKENSTYVNFYKAKPKQEAAETPKF